MRNSLWKLKRRSLIKAAIKSAPRNLRQLVKSACDRPSDIRQIKELAIDLSTQKISLKPLEKPISKLASNSYTIPDARNLLLGLCRGSSKAGNSEEVLLLAKTVLPSLELQSDSRLIPALIQCSLNCDDEKLALQIATIGIDDEFCRSIGINLVTGIIQKNRTILSDSEISASVGKLLFELREDFEFSNSNCKFIFRHFKSINPVAAVHYGLMGDDYSDPDFSRVLCRILNENEMIKESHEVSRIVSRNTADPWHTLQVELYDAKKKTPSEITEAIENLPSTLTPDEDYRQIENYMKENRLNIWIIYNIFNRLFTVHYEYRAAGQLALNCGEILLEAGHREAELIIKLSNLKMYDGHFSEAYSLLEQADPHPSVDKKMASIKSRIELLEQSLSISPDFSDSNPIDLDTLFQDRVLYMLHNSLPFESGGYATRSHGLLCGVKNNGWDIQGVTRLSYPLDLTKHGGKTIPLNSMIDEVPYHRLHPHEVGYGDMPLRDYISQYAEKLHELCQSLRPSLLHGASNHMNGHAANLVAKEIGIPSIYEVRGLWEITRASRQPNWEGSQQYNFVKNMEAKAAKDATAVICITQALADEMIRRGVDSEKITLVHNGVHVDRFTPRKPNNKLANKLGLQDQVVIGYVGSIVGYEGLNLLVEAAEKLQERDILNFVLLIVGDGAALEALEDQVALSSASKHFIFTGRVPHEEVESYYSLIDIAPFPRISLPVTEMVSPLKPFEAMAMEKLVIASDVAALEEIVNHEVTGLLFKKDDVNSLTDTLELGITDSRLRNKLGKQAREWVKAERDWPILAKRITDLYESLTVTND